MISKRSKSVDSSGIRKVFDLAAKLKDPINLSIGQPDFDAFPEIKKATIDAINSRKNGYTQTQGIPELREKIQNKYGLKPGDGRSCFVTSGVSGGLFLSYLSMMDPGDEILIPDPYFVMYRDLASLVNITPRCYNTYPDFKIRAEELEKSYNPAVKAIIIASPGNPTGYALTEEEYKTIVDFAKVHDLWLIFDEIYECFCYDRPHIKALGSYEKLLILGGYSKSHGVPGWRMGYAIGSDLLINEMTKLQQYTFVCAPSIAQWGLVGGFEIDFSGKLEDYRRKRNFIYQALKDKYNVEKPGGAFYIFPEAPGKKAKEFVEKCIENNLLLVPGSVFSTRDTHFRLSFSAPMEKLEQGAEILLKLVK